MISAAIPAAEWRGMSGPEQEMFAVLSSLRGEEVRREWRFDPRRKYRADFALPLRRILVEVEGGIWSRGRHVRGRGFEADCEKYNRAALLGWCVLRFTPDMIRSGEAEKTIREAIRR